MKKLGGGHEPTPMSDETQAKVGKRLDDVAKILAGALVAVAGIMTTLGLTSDIVFVALNNESWPIYVACLCAILAIVCSIVALLIRPTRRGNLWETIVLVLGVVFYMVALSVAVIGASKAAGGNGRPSITDVKLEGPRSDLKLTFTVHADGVDTWATIEVYGNAVTRHGDPLDGVADFYSSTLRPNDKGVVEQRITTPVVVPAKAWGIEVGAVVANGPEQCETLDQRGPTCAVIQLP
ncbi:hypothetical protein [Streptomyces coffeae]|uniref:DUF4190 domain-containing protein n=1 Tax=Streptomyces coffeae TaxID=621382 RepID=A0ABS1NKH9_9ACTN|nr:hypothetical protein [Streptomyces coffeae]MBL1100609.1 hypothetical protein [Streptomyces coffeae]